MQLRARLVHADAGQRVVQVSAWQGDACLGSALGEAGDAEQAEERALARLLERLEHQPAGQAAGDPLPGAGHRQPQARPAAMARQDSATGSAPLRRLGPGAAPAVPGSTPAPVQSPAPAAPQQSSLDLRAPVPAAPASGSAPAPLAGSAPSAPAPAPSALSPSSAPAQHASPPPEPAIAVPPPEPPPADPDDWSDELAALDLQLQRIGWQREQEATYLERAFGHPSRSRLTTYRDLSAYLQAVSQFAPGADPASAPVPLRRSDLLGQCDLLLGQLGWDAGRGRRFLEEQFQLASRQQLSDEQLLHFNMLLESELLALPEAATPPQAAGPSQPVVLPQTPGPGAAKGGPGLPLGAG